MSISTSSPGGRLADRLEVRLHGSHLRDGCEDRRLHVLGDLVCALERQIARQLEMERDLEAPIDLDRRQIVDLADMGDGESGGEHALAECRLLALRLDVNDDVDPRERSVQGLLDAIRGSVALADRRAGRDADDDIGEVLAACPP